MKIVLVLISLVAFTITPSCGGTQSGNTLGDKVASCATVDIGKTLPEIGMTIFQDVSVIVQAGKDGWVAALENIGFRYGYDALTCALQAVYDKLTAHPAGTMAAAPSDAAKRAQLFMVSHGLKAAP